MPVTTEWPSGWDMILRRPLFSESERNNAAWDGGRDRKTTFRQTGGKQQTVCDRKSVAYRSKQGNCIDSFHPNRLHKPITLWRIPQSPQKSKKGLMLWMKPRTKIYLSVWAKKKKYHCAERQKVRAFRIGISPPTCFGIYAENRPARNILHF